jgi:signal transduction histidine kinase
MKTYFVLIIFLLFCHISAIAVNKHYFHIADTSLIQHQKRKTDSLNCEYKINQLTHLLNQGGNDSAKVFRLTNYYRNISHYNFYCSSSNQLERLISNAYSTITLAEKLKYRVGLAYVIVSLANDFEQSDDLKNAIKYYLLALNEIEVAENNSQEENESTFFSPLLNLYFYFGNYSGAMEIATREMKIAEKNGDKLSIAHCNNLFGYIYFMEEDYQNAEKYYQLAYQDAVKLKDSVQIVHSLSEMAEVYIQQGKDKQSLNVLFHALKLYNLIVDTVNSLHAADTKYQLSIHQDYEAKIKYRIGKAYIIKEDYKNALKYSLEAVNYSKKHNTNLYDIASYTISTGNIYKKMGKNEQAIACLNYGYHLAQQIHHKDNMKDAAAYLADVYVAKSKYDSAYFYFHIYASLKDSIQNTETKLKIADLQVRYELAKKDEEINRQKQLQYSLITGFAIILLIVLLNYRNYRLKQKNKYQKERNMQQIEIFNAIVTAQDQERKRIAQDIHDSVGSLLSAAKLKFSSLDDAQSKISEDTLYKFKQAEALLDEAATELRNISHNMMPASLSKLGLVAAINNLLEKISDHSNIRFNLNAYQFEERLDETTEISIYQILLELINNIVKHSGADKATIEMNKYTSYINLMVEDNGKGFVYDLTKKEKIGIGLTNIISRVGILKGTIDIDSGQDKGTTVIIDIPLT